MKYVLNTLMTIFISLVFLLTLILFWPSILVNGHTLKFAANRLSRLGTKISWDGLADIQVHSISFTKKRFSFGFAKPCIKSNDIQGCFSRVALSFELDFASLPIQVDRLGPLTVDEGDLDIRTGSTADKKSNQEPLKPAQKKKKRWDRWISFNKMKLEPIQLIMNHLKIDDLEGSVHLISDREPGQWSGGLTINRLSDFRDINADFRLRNAKANGSGRWQLALGSDGQLEIGSVGIEASFLQTGSELTNFSYILRGFLNGRGRLFADLKGKYRTGHITSEVAAWFIAGRAPEVEDRHGFHHESGAITRARVEHCQIDLSQIEVRARGQRPEAGGFSGNIGLNCPTFLDVNLPSISRIPKLKLPKSIEGLVKAELRTTYPLSISDPADGHVSIELKSIQHPLFRGDGNISATVSGIPEKFPDQWIVDSEVGVRIFIPSFAKAGEILKSTPFAVPAPVNAMDGSVEVIAKGGGGLNGGKVPIFVKTHLASQFQKLNMDGEGSLEIEKISSGFRESLQMDAVLSDAVLALPRLSLEQPPRLLPDTRIHGPDIQGPQQESSFHYLLHFTTPEENPLKILSNLAQAPVPVGLDLTLGDQVPVTGGFRISRFPLEVLKRNAELVSFNLKFEPDTSNHPIDGRIRINYTDYIIHIRVFGSSEKPKISLTSDPPLPEAQVIAVLLFGRTLDEHDPTQGESVVNAQAAVADGAIGLASLYLLASTPVESLGYDPSTGVVSAKVHLGEGTSLNFGGSNEQKYVGVRRRLSRFWTVETELANKTDSTTLSGLTALLEWSHRY